MSEVQFGLWSYSCPSDCQNWTTAKQESNFLITTMITERIGQRKVIIPSNQNHNKIWKRNQTSVIY